MKRALAVLLLSLPALCLAQTGPYPQCERFPIYRAYGDLKKAGLLVEDLDYSNTQAVLLAAEKLRKNPHVGQVWRLVYHITYHEKSGRVVKIITANESADEECTVSPVEVFILSGHIPPAGTGRMFQDIE